jgi:hypothetical protein
MKGMNTMNVRFVAVGLMLSAGVGCGDDEGGSKSSGVDGDKQASAITAQEAEQLCGWLSELVSPTDEQVCTFTALFLAQDEATCKTLVDECIKSGEEPVEKESCEGFEVPEGCSATVAELETCARDMAKQSQAALDELSCADAGKTGAVEPSESPASCKPVDEKCPGFWEADDGTTSSDFSSDDDEDDDVFGGGGDFSSEEFDCGDGGSYTDFDRCDGFVDCDNGADEADC